MVVVVFVLNQVKVMVVVTIIVLVVAVTVAIAAKQSVTFIHSAAAAFTAIGSCDESDSLQDFPRTTLHCAGKKYSSILQRFSVFALVHTVMCQGRSIPVFLSICPYRTARAKKGAVFLNSFHPLPFSHRNTSQAIAIGAYFWSRVPFTFLQPSDSIQYKKVE